MEKSELCKRTEALSFHLRRAYGLSAREAEVASMVADGLQNEEIALALGTSPETVRKQTIRAYEKLRVSGRVQLAARFGHLLDAAADLPR